MNDQCKCGTALGMPPLRPELQAAFDELYANPDYFAFAVCRSPNGQAWEVNVREANITWCLETCGTENEYPSYDEAMAAGAAWLQEQINREPSADDMAFRKLWEDWCSQADERL
ncbi:hypothetical protein [Sinimarinibacterium thermocellulolyticum]